jgi:hypothetical protein
MIGYIHPPPLDPLLSDKPLLFVTVTNVGRRPILVTGWGLELEKPNGERAAYMVVPRFMPKRLEEHEQVKECTDQLSNINNNLKKIYVEDATGKEWLLPDKNLPRIIAKANEIRDGAYK